MRVCETKNDQTSPKFEELSRECEIAEIKETGTIFKSPSPNVMCDCVFPIFNLLISVGETEYQSNGSSTHLKLLLVSMLEAGMRQRGSSSGVTVLVPTKWHLDSSTSSPRHPLFRYCVSADMCSMRVETFGMYSHYVGSDPNVMPHPSEIFIV